MENKQTMENTMRNTVRRVITRKPRMTLNEKIQAQKVNAIKYYHRKKALQQFINNIADNEKENNELIEVEVKYKSRVLGDVHEIITYRVHDFDKGLFSIECVSEIITEPIPKSRTESHSDN